MPTETLRVWLFSKELIEMPHKVRSNLASNFDLRCPVPPELVFPAGQNGEKPRTYIRRFALIKGGDPGAILAVYYIEK